MSCSADNARTFGPIVVFTSGSTSSWLFHPVGPPEPSSQVGTMMRPNLNIQQTSGNVKIRLAMRMSNDGLTFDTPVAIGALERAQLGAAYGSSFSNLATTLASKRLVHFGIESVNDSGTRVEVASASAELDYERSS